jgi:kelch-like protein 9/13
MLNQLKKKGREINPYPSLHDDCNLMQIPINSQHIGNTTTLTKLPNMLSHMQCVVSEKNFLYVLGGCVSQCAHGESATNSVHRYDPRLSAWLNVECMREKRAYFYACAFSNKSNTFDTNDNNANDAIKSTKEFIYSFGGKNKEGDLCTVERYDLETNTWTYVRPMVNTCYAHAGCVADNKMYAFFFYRFFGREKRQKIIHLKKEL